MSEDFEKYNRVLYKTCDFHYHAPDSISKNAVDSNDDTYNQILTSETLTGVFGKKKPNTNWHVMLKEDGIFWCFWQGNFLTRRGKFEALSPKLRDETMRAPEAIGDGTTFRDKKRGEDPRYNIFVVESKKDHFPHLHEERVRVYCNRLCALIWWEYYQEVKKLSKKSEPISSLEAIYKTMYAEKNYDTILEEPSSRLILDYNHWKKAKSPISLLLELCCKKRQTIAEMENQEAMNKIIHSDNTTNEAKQEVFVKNMVAMQHQERYKDFDKLIHDKENHSYFCRWYDVRYLNDNSARSYWEQKFTDALNDGEQQTKNEIRRETYKNNKILQNVFKEPVRKTDEYCLEMQIFDVMIPSELQKKSLSLPKRLAIVRRCIEKLNTILAMSLKQHGRWTHNAIINARVVNIVPVSQSHEIEVLLKSAFKNNYEGLIMTACPESNALYDAKTQDKQQQTCISYKLKRQWDIFGSIEKMAEDKLYQVTLKDKSCVDMKLNFSSCALPGIWKYVGPWTAKDQKIDDPTRSQIMDRTISVKRSKTTERLEELWQQNKKQYVTNVRFRVTSWNSSSQPDQNDPILIRTIYPIKEKYEVDEQSANDQNLVLKRSDREGDYIDICAFIFQSQEKLCTEETNQKIQNVMKNMQRENIMINDQELKQFLTERLNDHNNGIIQSVLECWRQNLYDNLLQIFILTSNDQNYKHLFGERLYRDLMTKYSKREFVTQNKHEFTYNEQVIKTTCNEGKELQGMKTVYGWFKEAENSVLPEIQNDYPEENLKDIKAVYTKALQKKTLEELITCCLRCDVLLSALENKKMSIDDMINKPNVTNKGKGPANEHTDDGYHLVVPSHEGDGAQSDDDGNMNSSDEHGQSSGQNSGGARSTTPTYQSSLVKAQNEVEELKANEKKMEIELAKYHQMVQIQQNQINELKADLEKAKRKHVEDEDDVGSPQRPAKIPVPEGGVDMQNAEETLGVEFWRKLIDTDLKHLTQDVVLRVMDEEIQRNQLQRQLYGVEDDRELEQTEKQRQIQELQRKMQVFKSNEWDYQEKLLRKNYRTALMGALTEQQVKNLTKELLAKSRTMDLDECMHALTLEVSPYFLYFDSPPSNSP